MRDDGRLVVLDVHGVVFNNPLVPYLLETARRHGRDEVEVLRRWSSQLRRPFWLGQLSVAQLWSSLFPGCDPTVLSAELEERYQAGPLLRALDTIDDPIWLLSNHRSEWLLPRIARFGLDDRFERVYVSDAIGFVKPEPQAFEFVRVLAAGRTVRYVDDNPVNVAAAGAIFEEALGLDQVDRLRGSAVG
jgi:putative hydrolase of the HAD superfamily